MTWKGRHPTNAAWSGRKILLLAAIVCISAILLGVLSSRFSSRDSSPLSVAQSLEVCNSARGDAAAVACARGIIDYLLTIHTTRELMTSISTGSIPSVFQGCHSVGHIIGSETFKKEKSVESAVAQCTRACGAACFHGVLGAAVAQYLGEEYNDEDIAHASFDEIKRIGAKYCTYTLLCHGVGHLFLMNTNKLLSALQGCDYVSSGFVNLMCQEGVFMQDAGTIKFSLILEDNEPARLKNVPNDDYAYPCNAVPSRYRHACFQYLAWYQEGIFQKKNITDPNIKIETFIRTCATFSAQDRSWCFEGLGRNPNTSGTSSAPVADALQRCSTLPKDDDRKSCIIGRMYYLTLFGKDTQAANYCATIDTALQTICYNALFQFEGTTTRLKIQPLNAKLFCSKSENPDLCDDAFQEYIRTKTTIPDYRFGFYGYVPSQ